MAKPNPNGKRCLVAIDRETHGKIAKWAQIEDRTLGAVVKRMAAAYERRDALDAEADKCR